MLSKYTAAFLVPSVFLYLLLSKRDRHWLWSPWPTLGGVCSLIVFAPVIYWNATHDWVSFRFQSTARFQAANGMSLGNGVQASLEQWLLVLPLTLPFAALVVWRLARSARPADKFLLWTFAPMAAFFFVLGWTPSWHMLWSLPAYLALTVAMAGGVAEIEGGLAGWFRRWWPAFAALEACVVLTAVVHATLVMPLFTPLRETYGWDEVGDRCAALRATLPEGSFYLATGTRPYPSASQLAFHMRAPFEVHGPTLIGQEGLQYRYWADSARLAGKDAVVVVEGGAGQEFVEQSLLPYFRSVEPAGEVDVSPGMLGTARRTAHYTLFVAHGYQPPAR
jgi:dolichol-phosphate mannosyltransferase